MSEGNNQVDPMRLSIEQAAKILSAAYRERIDVSQLQDDIDSGAPTNPDGTLNLVNYAAWQSEEMGRAD